MSLRRFSLHTAGVTAVFAIVLGLSLLIGTALAASTNCYVNASGGYKNCLTTSNPNVEIVKGWHGAGTPYRWKLHRFSNGGTWGYWQYADLNYHVLHLSLGGSITSQVDNRGSANPAAYYLSHQ
ncbi:MAG: hypothetical protein ACR2N6_04995 [Miltoncostaeaceae bacterium]